MIERASWPPWRTVSHDIYASSHSDTVETIFRLAIEPSCRAIATELNACKTEGDNAELNRRDDLRRAQLELHRSLAFMLGGLWERNFQQMLLRSVHIADEQERDNLRTQITRGRGNDLCNAFLKIRGFELSNFPMYPELLLLNRVTSAVRHGDGPSVKKVWDLDKAMFLSDVEPMNWLTYFTHGGDGETSVSKLEVTFDQLIKFKNAIVSFWLEIDEMRRNGT